MSLYVIATPIGNSNDMGIRALELLKNSEIIITEERKVGSKLLREFEIKGKQLEELNEHTNKEELISLVKLCDNNIVCLISDAGTPGFCDPGADLVKECRKRNIEVKSVPGPSSLMSLLSVTGIRIDQFYFRGFLSPKTEMRSEEIIALKKIKVPIILMDTPYRLKKTLMDLEQNDPKRKLILGLNLSTENEEVLYGNASKMLSTLKIEKAEFVLILLNEEV